MRAYWTARETLILKKLYPKYMEGLVAREDILKIIKRHNWHAIANRASLLEITNKHKDNIDEEYYQKLLKTIEI